MPPAPQPVSVPAAPTDAEVVRRVLAGEIALFELLVRRSNARLHRAIRAVLRDEAEVEDAMQAAYLKAYLALDQFQGEAAFSTWLVRIGVNEALARLRGSARTLLLEAVPETEAGAMAGNAAEDPEARAASAEAARLLERAIDRLPTTQRVVYVLRELEGLSTSEAAAALSLSEEAVKVRLHRARLALRDHLAAEVGRAAGEAFSFLAPRCDRMAARVMAALLAPRPA